MLETFGANHEGKNDYSGKQMSVNMGAKLLNLDDESLICRIQEGNHEAFSTLVDRHSNRFYNSAYRLPVFGSCGRYLRLLSGQTGRTAGSN